MGKNASGMYVIDADYNIVSYNHAAEIIYPELKKGEKCYRCLLHNEESCESCPVVNGIEGPKNYLEPRRNVLRSIDAVEIPLESGEMEHAMIFSAAEATEEAVVEAEEAEPPQAVRAAAAPAIPAAVRKLRRENCSAIL